VCGGVLERFPELAIVSAENDCGWVPHFLFRLDHAHEKFGQYADRPLPLAPSAYARRQIFFTFQEDSTGWSNAVESAERFLWASDYPHVDSTWPNSRDAIDRALAGLEEWFVRRIVGDNAADLYDCGTNRAALV
jgi:uncharacterized protein